jgi:tRNA A-37 threonylcarbamoyl transferase component Bud32
VSWDFSQSPDQAWQNAGQLPCGNDDPDLSAQDPGILIQDEPRIRIVMAVADGASTRRISKIYRTPLALTWRDLFRYPQAQREFENLQYAFKKGLPVAEPLGFGLKRFPGRDWFSQLTIGYLEGITLRDVLGQPGKDEEGLAALIAEAGRLVARMHKAGMIWGTAHSGNFMVNSEPGSVMSAFDFPYALCTDKNMVGSRFALYDVWNMAFDSRKHCRLDLSLFDLFYEAYGHETGTDWSILQSQVNACRGRKAVFWQRLYIRTVRSFRLKPF